MSKQYLPQVPSWWPVEGSTLRDSRNECVTPFTQEQVTLVLTGSRWTQDDGTVHYVTRCGVFRPEQLADYHLSVVPAATP